jgi:RNA polymerase sigma factor (sigma-70 family)
MIEEAYAVMACAGTMSLPLELRILLSELTAAQVADDQQWILALLKKNGHPVITLLWRMLGSEQDVLDAYQTAVCQLAGRGRAAVKANPGGYFYRIALNAGIGILRNRKQQQKSWPAVADAHARRQADQAEAQARCGCDQREILDRMRQMVHLLPPHLRDVILLRDLAELPYSQVALILGIKSGTARIYRHQAVVRLADMLGQEVVE